MKQVTKEHFYNVLHETESPNDSITVRSEYRKEEGEMRVDWIFRNSRRLFGKTITHYNIMEHGLETKSYFLA